MMKLIIAGSRDSFISTEKLGELIVEHFPHTTEIVSGGARGIDRCGEEYAKKWLKKLTLFPADWDTHGKSAGYD